MTELELEAIIQRAAEAGAKKALRDVGLQDDDAVHDVREVRDLLDSWRSVKRTAGKTFIQIMTSIILRLLRCPGNGVLL
jgi:IS4 transposase